MSSRQEFTVAARLGIATAITTFALMVLGGVVRATGAGLACPDWPLCHGQLIPPMDPLVLVEWLHRLMALFVSVLLLATTAWIFIRHELRRRLGGLGVLAIALLFAQVLLGALTVWHLLDPSIVSGHLAIAMLLFVTMLLLTWRARHHAREVVDLPVRPMGLFPWLALAALLTYGQALLGGIVSSNYAGLVCPDWPTCQGQWFPSHGTLEGLHMMHRWGAYLLVLVMMGVALVGRVAPDRAIRRGGFLALGLVALQVLIGIGNVLMRIPVWMTAMHLATALLLLATTSFLAFRAALLPTRAAVMTTAEARSRA